MFLAYIIFNSYCRYIKFIIQPTGGGKAAITGDFVLLASEVNPVIKAFAAKLKRSILSIKKV
jgi:hypothetical protein